MGILEALGLRREEEPYALAALMYDPSKDEYEVLAARMPTSPAEFVSAAVFCNLQIARYFENVDQERLDRMKELLPSLPKDGSIHDAADVLEAKLAEAVKK
ncbi:hypothetical protein ACFL1B_02795 [Nanoarchaeota archaeon]